ncbi:hypothetical protein [Cupriavidus gilardii]|uniref:hypothetical protein n=1 Tax=Cupriavidus gilardii TaxID=82541 RepID=UPI0021B23E48|nr:hypothetical protein [Cupriavidus gilardii]UXC38252.1 hypothetical protein N4G38_24640 [Cupriavidus gilardii]
MKTTGAGLDVALVFIGLAELVLEAAALQVLVKALVSHDRLVGTGLRLRARHGSALRTTANDTNTDHHDRQPHRTDEKHELSHPASPK